MLIVEKYSLNHQPNCFQNCIFILEKMFKESEFGPEKEKR